MSGLAMQGGKEMILEIFNTHYANDPVLQRLGSYTLAGGCFRDIVLGCDVVDLDIFLDSPRGYSFMYIDDSLGAERVVEDTEDYANSFSDKYRLGGKVYNFIVHSEQYANRSVESFSADISKMGVKVVDNRVIEVYSEGLEAIERREIRFMSDDYLALQAYAYKMAQKPWAKHFLFVCEMPEYGYREEARASQVVFNKGSHKSIPMSVMLREFGLFYGQELSKEFENKWFAFSVNLDSATRYLSGDAQHRFSFTEGREMLEEAYHEGFFEDLDVLGYFRAHPEKIEVVEDIIGKNIEKAYNRVEIHEYANGWEILGQLDKEEQELFVHGKKRKALLPVLGQSESYYAEMLKAQGYGNNLACFLDFSLPSVYMLPASFKLKAKQLGGKKFSIPSELLSTLAWGNVLGEAALLLKGSWLNHSPKESVVVPPKFQKAVATSESLMNLLFMFAVPVDWSLASSARLCALRTIMRDVGVDENAAEMILANPALMKAGEYMAKNDNSHIEVSETFPRKKYEWNGYTLEMLPKQSIDNLLMGEYTACCQHMDGAGKAVVFDGWKDPHSVNYVIRSSSGTIRAHFWVWESEDGHLVLDSLEGRRENSIKEAALALVKMFLADNANVVIGDCNYGFTKELLAELDICNRQTAPEPISEYGYMDAEIVMVPSTSYDVILLGFEAHSEEDDEQWEAAQDFFEDEEDNWSNIENLLDNF